jgi:hypothetical protein
LFSREEEDIQRYVVRKPTAEDFSDPQNQGTVLRPRRHNAQCDGLLTLRLEADASEIGASNIGTSRELQEQFALERILYLPALFAEEFDASFAALDRAPTPCVE